MAKKKQRHRRKSNNNHALWFIVVFLILVIVSVFLSYYYTHNIENGSGNKAVNKNSDSLFRKPLPAITKVKSSLDGTWVSEYDGAMMEIHGNNYTLEFPSVNSREIIHGTLRLKGNEVTFFYTTGSQTCNGKEGKYRFEKKKKKLLFKIVNDACSSRSERMSAAWVSL